MNEPTGNGFTPIRPNPFIVGNPVRERSMFFGREAEFELVRLRFQDSTQGGLLVFCGERRSGKTSILFQILDKRLGPAFIPVLIDMQSMAISSEIDFLEKIAGEIREALGPEAADVPVPDFTGTGTPSATFQRFIERLLRHFPNRKLLLLFDEYELFENKIEAGVMTPDVLHILASLMERLSVFLIFTGSQHLEQRKEHFWKILGKSIYKTISYLDRDDALSLICKPVAGQVEYGEGAVETIYRMSAGQPFYTQAICQSMVDLLNEKCTSHVSRDTILEVTDGIVNNPLPQMIFMWDTLERDEKLVLALLAETLADENAMASEKQLCRLIAERKYPLDLGRSRIAPTLEKLFKSELLLKNDAYPPAYSFKMDLWRLWIRRMHSVWQVMREEGLEIRQRPRRWRGLAAIGAVALLAGAAFVLNLIRGGREGGGGAPSPGPGRTQGALSLRAEPASAEIFLDGKRSGVGVLQDTTLAPGQHVVRLASPGYADTTLVLALAGGQALERIVSLRPLLGNLMVKTNPPGAEIVVDGRARGTSPRLVSGLRVADAHVVEATLAGYGPARGSFTVRADTVLQAGLDLGTGRASVRVTTEPPGAEVLVDGQSRGRTPLPPLEMTLGRRRFQFQLAGYQPADTTLDVQASTSQLHLGLRPEPPGTLIVLGDYPGQIYIDDRLIKENSQNSGPQRLPGGTHRIKVVLVSGSPIEESVLVKPGVEVRYDYTQRKTEYTNGP